MDRLSNLGFSERLQQASLFPDWFLGRIITQTKDIYGVATENSEVFAEISGKLRHDAIQMSDYPAVGDFVMMDRADSLSGNAIIHRILDRKSVFVRRAAGSSHDIQVIAANIDVVFICMSLNNDFNLRRLERYLSISWESGATPVVVLTKSDLCPDFLVKIKEIEEVAIGVDVLITSSMLEDGYQSILKYIEQGRTVAFMGSSGVGKSTLINRLIGEELIHTGDIRKDDKGRHTTTRRELIMIPTGGAVIDTPGMRELGIVGGEQAKTFIDIDQLAEGCKFKHCKHESEPGCLVKKAIEDGELTAERLISYKKLQKEAEYEGLNSRQIEHKKINEMFSSFGGIKNAQAYIKSKKNR